MSEDSNLSEYVRGALEGARRWETAIELERIRFVTAVVSAGVRANPDIGRVDERADTIVDNLTLAALRAWHKHLEGEGDSDE